MRNAEGRTINSAHTPGPPLPPGRALPRSPSPPPPPPLAQAASQDKPHDAQWDTIGFGLAGFHRAGWRTDFTALDTTDVLAAYRRARRRAIFVDWGGTLVNIEDGFSPLLVEYYRDRLSPSLFSCLEQLASEPRNLLMVLSGQVRLAWRGRGREAAAWRGKRGGGGRKGGWGGGVYVEVAWGGSAGQRDRG